MSKYKNNKIEIDWIKFDSKSEAEYFMMCKRDPNIKNLRLQPRYILQEKFERNWQKFQAIEYRSDFEYTIGNETVVVDVKWLATAEAKMKRKMFLKNFPDHTLIRIVKFQWSFVEYFANEQRKKNNKKAKIF